MSETDETPPAPARPPDSAAWLVGPEEGLAAEMERKGADGSELRRPTLLRPTLPPGAAESPPAPVAPAPDRAPALKRFGAVLPEADAGPDLVRGMAMTWAPGTPSVPRLRRDSPPPREHAARAPATHREFPMDEPEERSRARTLEIEAAAEALTPPARPHLVVPPSAFGEVVPVLPWWIEIFHQLRTDRRLQGLLALVPLVLAIVAFFPHGSQPTSLSGIRRRADHFDGERVRVSGRIGQVFPVGGGYAFYLFQGGDTLVVFTRTRRPVEGDRANVSGTMSNGYLDGQATLALFEDTGSGH